MKTITLEGFGELTEPGEREQLAEAAKRYGVEFYAGYYDHGLKGTAKAVEAVTKDLWSMPRSQWGENGLTETVLYSQMPDRAALDSTLTQFMGHVEMHAAQYEETTGLKDARLEAAIKDLYDAREVVRDYVDTCDMPF